MKDMRDFIAKAEEAGQLKRISAEVDWNLELSHIAKLNEEKGGPALLFENVKGYDSPVITSVCTTTQRLALIMNAPRDSTLVDLMRLWVEKHEDRSCLSARDYQQRRSPCAAGSHPLQRLDDRSDSGHGQAGGNSLSFYDS